MRGSLQRAKKDRANLPKGHHTFNIILSLGRGSDGKWKQRWIRFHGTRKHAQEKLTTLVGEVHHGEFVEPSKLTVGTYLDEWLETAIKPRRTLNTYNAYSNVIRNHLKKAFDTIPLQKLNAMHVERYYAESKLSAVTLTVHHAVLGSALKAAVKKHLLRTNVASLVANKPQMTTGGDVLDNVWTASEAHQFLTTVKATGSEQDIALFALALDSGARRGELMGLQWRDLEGNKLRIERQVMRGSLEDPQYIPPKRGGIRSVDLSDDTVALLHKHKRKQAELKMANRTKYHDHGLLFARAWEHVSSKNSLLGAPLPPFAINGLLSALCRTAGVREITPHGLRHTCATLMLLVGVPPHVVQMRLGHKKIKMTLEVYSHVLPSMQEEAASRLGTVLHGTT